MAQDQEVTTAGAAKILGVSKATIVKYADAGLLKCRRLPSTSGQGHRRYLNADVEELRQRTAPVERAS